MDEVGQDGSVVLDRARLPGRDAPATIVVSTGTIVAVRPAGAVEGGPGPRVDLDGRTVLPGLWDTHVHTEQWAIARRRLDLRGAVTARAAADRVAAAAEPVTAGPLVGVGFRGALWTDQPHKDLLQAAAPDREVALFSHDLHTAWLSPAGLVRIGAAEHPTGVLQERDCYRAMGAFQEFDRDTVDRWVVEALTAAAARGVTGIIDFEFGDSLPAWRRRAREHRVDTRVTCTVYREHLESAVARGLPTGSVLPDAGGLIEVGPLKLFVDGSLNSRTALCHDPYLGLDGTEHGHGLLETDPEDLRAVMGHAADHGFESAVHAIGDRAIEVALDAFEAVGCRGRIEHAQLVAARDVERFARPGLVAGVQPAHLLDDRDVAERLWPQRTDRVFPLADLLAAGARIEFGSDAPVAALDPWTAVATAVTRTSDGREPWHPEQRIGVADALAASSRGRAGVVVGDPADLVVLDHDPYRIDAARLADPGVAGTLCAGRWTHRAL
jgi:predicted amidohydrolase YtcJ